MSSGPRTVVRETRVRGRRYPGCRIYERELWSHTPVSGGHIFRGQLRMLFVYTDPSSYLTVHAANGSAGTTWGPLFGFSLRIILRWRTVR